MKKLIKAVIIFLGSSAGVLMILLSIYIIANRQEHIMSEQYGSPESKHSILIASQGSNFKNELVKKLVDEFSTDSTYISVKDCRDLDNEKRTDWDAIVLIYATQIHGMPEAAEDYLQLFEASSRITIVSTSGSGDEKPHGLPFDAISTASRSSGLDKVYEICKNNITLAIK